MLKRSPRSHREGAALLTADDRSNLVALLHRDVEPLFFPFGGAAAALRTRADGALVFALMSKDFPLQAHPALVLEDLPRDPTEGFGRLGRFWAGNRQGLREVERSSADAETQATLSKLLDAFRRTALLAGAYHAAVTSAMVSREEFLGATRLERSLRRQAESSQDLAQAGLDIVERVCPASADANARLVDALEPPTPLTELAPSPDLSGQRPPALLSASRPDWRLVTPGAVGPDERLIPVAGGPR
jgi:hypothetical protein